MQSMLADQNIAGFLDEDLLARRGDGQKQVHGCFMVQDRPGKYRLIFDGS